MKRFLWSNALGLALFTCVGLFNKANAQKIEFNIHNGLCFPMVKFKNNEQSLKYKTSIINDTRLGISYLPTGSFSFGVNIGYQNIEATHYDQYYQTTFENNYLILELTAGKALKSKIIDKIIISPTMSRFISGTQTFNNFNINPKDGFKKNSFLINTQFNFKGVSSQYTGINPYVGFRYMLSNSDLNSKDKLKIHNFLLGVLISIKYEK
jgi:hypothetical protein